MKVCVCAIAKMENHYIREWVEHYKSIGFDKIFLYDNNDVDGERFEEVINDYIQSSFVEIIDFRGRISTDNFNLQSYSYQDCYTKHKNEYDWFLIVDCDEFLHISNYRNIKELLDNEKYNGFEGIRFQWMNMDDNNLIHVVDGDYSLQKRFTNGKMNKYGKSIIRGWLDIKSNEFHGHSFRNHTYCDATGIQCKPMDQTDNSVLVQDYIVDTDIFIKHYRSKTIQEWIDIKLKRLYPDKSREKAFQLLTINTFFSWNKKTQDKIDYIKSRGFKI